MQTVNVHAAKTHFSRLLDQAAAGEEIIITKGGKPVAAGTLRHFRTSAIF
jgi:prevent-host-death family protein